MGRADASVLKDETLQKSTSRRSYQPDGSFATLLRFRPPDEFALTRCVPFGCTVEAHHKLPVPYGIPREYSIRVRALRIGALRIGWLLNATIAAVPQP